MLSLKDHTQMLRKLSLILVTCSAGFGPRLLAQDPQHTPSELKTQIVQDLPKWLQQYNVASVAVAYIANGKVAWTAVAGQQSPGVPASDRTLFNIASLTKPITAETILRMASQGKLQLDEPIYPYWVDPDVKDNLWNKLLTPRLCLSHQTGFSNWRRMSKGILTFNFQPGTQSKYSGEGYFYVARFAQKKANKPFDQLAQRYVLGPVGMKATSFTTQKWFSGRIAEPYGENGFLEPQLASTWNAADLVRTTVADYARFVISVMNNEELSPDIAAQRLVMTRDWTSADERKQACAKEVDGGPCQFSAGMGLGWQIIVHNGVTIVDHSGSDTGANSQAFFVPAKRLGAVIFTSGGNGPKVIGEIVRLLYPDPVYAETTSH